MIGGLNLWIALVNEKRGGRSEAEERMGSEAPSAMHIFH
jgi:hypothetical protein